MYQGKSMKGFTLVELSLVIVIVALIIAGVVAGQNLIRVARLQSVITKSEQFKTAINAFKLEYNTLPGDMPRAFDYWGSVTCTNDMDEDIGCNGDGDKKIEWYNGSNREGLLIWVHLALAKLIPGSYANSDPATNQGIAGVNVPGGSLVDSQWWASSTSDTLGVPVYPTTLRSLSMVGIGGYYSNNAGFGSLFTPKEAVSIDKKLDDGLPETGVVFSGGGCTGGGWTCSSSCTSGNSYQLDVNTKECYMGFLLPY